ncbi:hypothetical protein [Flavobacterium sp. KACC 22763]|uniref:hypothetical protein n=1 Tax=Flavobacterium sp. KACC 22763 TaxID=3025668 RepID=UPI00236558C2|nr:hypothetical protein [Flavobacterium sp. KACC 22763]WDF63046.1 hypothetical protein PQ463_15665 [Flavobacterium sp. KACC 22763]
MKFSKKIFITFFSLITLIAKAQTNNWKIFKINNQYYDVTIEFPSYFKEGIFTNSQIQYYDSYLTDNPNKNTIFYIEMYGKSTKKDLTDEYKQRIKTETGIKYNTLKDNFFVISEKNNNIINYQKTIFKKGQIYSLHIMYDTKYKEIIESILPRISKSFR